MRYKLKIVFACCFAGMLLGMQEPEKGVLDILGAHDAEYVRVSMINTTGYVDKNLDESILKECRLSEEDKDEHKVIAFQLTDVRGKTKNVSLVLKTDSEKGPEETVGDFFFREVDKFVYALIEEAEKGMYDPSRPKFEYAMPVHNSSDRASILKIILEY